MLHSMRAWLAFITIIAFYSSPSLTYLVEDEPEEDVTIPPNQFDYDNQNYSTMSHAEKMAIAAKPFRPSKQLFDHIVYRNNHNLSIKRVDHISKSFDTSEAEPETFNAQYKPLDSSFSNLLILPPETLTYNWDQGYNSGSTDVNDEEKNKEVDIITHGPPIEDSEAETSNTEIRVHENPIKSKMREIHYHKHKHLHEYDQKQEHNMKSIQDYLQSRRHVQRHAINSEHKAEQQNHKSKTDSRQRQQYHPYFKDDDFIKNLEDQPNHYNSKRHNRNQSQLEFPRQSSHPRHGEYSTVQQVRHDHPIPHTERNPPSKHHSEDQRLHKRKRLHVHHRGTKDRELSSEEVNSYEEEQNLRSRQKNSENRHFKTEDEKHFRGY